MNKDVETVANLKKKLEKGCGYEKTLHILHKLQKIPITIDLLHKTGIGKTVRNLSKQNSDSDIGKTAKLLCLTWKASVKEEQEQEEQQDDSQYNSPSDETVVKEEEPDYEDEVESSYNSIYEKSNHKIKREYNRSDDEEMDRSFGDSSSYEKRKPNEIDSKSDKRHKKHKSSHKSRESESTVSSKTEFETMLGLNDEIIKTNKKSPIKSKDTEKHKKSNSYDKNKCIVKTERIEDWSDSPSKSRVNNGFPKELESKSALKAVDPSDILSSLPTPNYKPLPNRDFIEDRLETNRRKQIKANEELSINVSSRKGRTAVFAGVARAKTYTHVPGLEELCLQVLMDNYDKLCYLGDAPYYLMKPVLQKCNPKQLSRIEKLNPHIMDETDELWRGFCAKEFRGREPDEDEDETWRECYYRCIQDRDNRLKNITKSISQKQRKAVPERQTQFADSVKTPREILRKQERSGYTAVGKAGHSGGGGGGSSSAYVKIVPDKPKVAPLMRKVLKLQKVRYRK